MRLLVCLPLLLALAAPTIAWSRQADLSQPMSSRPVLMMPPAAPTAASRPGNTQGGNTQAGNTQAGNTQGGNIQAADPAALCEAAVAAAELVQRLPARMLGAISVTETGRIDPVRGHLRPWPWTINAEGEGQFFATKQQAIAAVKVLQARGVRSIDVGCMQVNLMFHPDAFASLEDAFDPRVNAGYAARFLDALYAEGRDWAHAIAAYHSETPVLGDAYRALVMARWQNGDIRAAVTPVGAYQDFAQVGRSYGAFAPRSQVYGAFAPR